MSINDQAKEILGQICGSIQEKEREFYTREDIIRQGIAINDKLIRFKPATPEQEVLVEKDSSRILYSFDPRIHGGRFTDSKCPLLYIIYGTEEELLKTMNSEEPVFSVTKKF